MYKITKISFTQYMSLKFIGNLGTSGAIMPTGKKVTEEVTAFINKSQKCIVEIGPGTGVFTKQILKQKHTDCNLICLEINETFVDIMLKNYPDVHTYHDSATEIEKYIGIHGFDTCDSIISGLPWASFSSQLQQEILESIYNSLSSDGTFSTFAYTGIHKMPAGKKFSGLLSDMFEVKKSRTFKSNTPPAFVYHCKKK